MIQLPFDRDALITAVENGTRFSFTFFWGHRKPAEGGVSKSCFSQWYEAPFTVAGERYRTAEHYMMAEKARLFGDDHAASRVLAAATPNEAKSWGRKVRGFSEDRWLTEREAIVFNGNVAKFAQNPGLKRFLLATADAVLVEASPVDAIWGIGLSQEDERATRPREWPGLNLLGFCLMKVRAQLAEELRTHPRPEGDRGR